MSIRFKFIAAALGLVVATGAIGDVSAKTLTKTPAKNVATHTIVHKTIVAGAHRRLHFGTRIVKHIRIVHRAPTLVKVVKAPAHKVVVTNIFRKKIVRLDHARLVRHAMFHRAGAKVTVIR